MDQATRTLLDIIGAGPLGLDAEHPAGTSDEEWDRAIETASRHGLAPMLYHGLRGLSNLSATDERARERLRGLYLHGALKNVRIFHQLAEALAIFNHASIPVMSIKGVHLARAAYGDVALRPMHDIDVLVKKDDLGRAERALVGAGYALKGDRGWYEKNHNHFIFVPASGGRDLEVHWGLDSPGSPTAIEVDGIWDRAVSAESAKGFVCAPSWEDALIYICAHACYPNPLATGLLPFCDLAAVIGRAKDELDWGAVLERSIEWRARRSVGLCLLLASDFFGGAVPPKALEAAGSSEVDPEAARRAVEKVLGYRAGDDSAPLSLARLAGERSRFGKSAKVLRALFPTPGYLANFHPSDRGSWRIFLRYPSHIAKVLGGGGRAVLGVIRRGRGLVDVYHRERAILEWLTPE